MGLGDNYSGNNNTDNNKKEYYSPEVYSDYYASNENGVDPSALSYSFWKGALKISIAPQLKNPTEMKKWDRKNAATVFLNHRAAKILFNEANRVIKGEISNGGAKSGSNLITFSNGKEVGADGYCLIIRSIDTSGEIKGTYVYQFRKGYHYGVSEFKANTSGFTKTYYDDIEIEEFLTILDQFCIAMSKADAYVVIDEMKYENSRINTKIGLIAESLGVEFKGAKVSGGSSSYFDNDSENHDSSSSSSKRSSARQTTLEGLTGAMNEPLPFDEE